VAGVVRERNSVTYKKSVWFMTNMSELTKYFREDLDDDALYEYRIVVA
jgi:hypothetical protein